MADKYLMKVGLDFDQAQFDKITGVISDEITSMGKISSKFTDNALATARKYNEEISKQQRIIDDIDKQLKRTDLTDKQRGFLMATREKAEGIKKDYQFGNAEKNMMSKDEVDAIANYAKSAQGFGDKVAKAGSVVTKGVAAISAGFNAGSAVIKKFVSEISSALDNFAEFSNKLNPLGAFGDQNQRGIMTRYGMTGTQALGFSNTLSAMGMSESDIGRMTEEQRKTFNSLNSYWNEQIGKLDPAALERYTETMSKYQEIVAKFNMGIQSTILKLVTNSPAFDKLVGKFEGFLNTTMEFLDSPIVQNIFDGLINFLTVVMSLLEKGMKLLASLGVTDGSNAKVVNNTTNTSNNNFNIYGSNYQDNSELARQISFASQGSYKG